jgi:SsrA-binding protein
MGQTVTVNRQARHEYFVLETYEAGIELFGTEIKSIRNGGVNLKGAWADISNGEVFVYGMHISPYEKGNIFNRDPFRDRKLLLHRKEIDKLAGRIKQDGLTLIPLSVYFNKQHIKIELGLCKGKKLYDKRETDAKKAAGRDIDRAIKSRG